MDEQVRTIDLANRVLAYREYGAADGLPLLYQHSFPSSGLEAAYIDASARDHGLRIIAIDRPGMGGSSISPNRSLTEMVRDVGVLINRLGIRKLGVLGIGGGAPYTWVLGQGMPRRIEALGVVSGEAGGQSHVVETAKAFLALGTLPFMSARVRDPEKAERMWTERFKGASPADQRAVADADFRSNHLAAMAEAFAEGSGGPAKDTALIHGADWGFPLAEVAVPSHVWHGGDDDQVSIEESRRVTDQVPGCEVTILDGEGHVSTWVNHHDEILATMADTLKGLRA